MSESEVSEYSDGDHLDLGPNIPFDGNSYPLNTELPAVQKVDERTRSENITLNSTPAIPLANLVSQDGAATALTTQQDENLYNFLGSLTRLSRDTVQPL